MATLALSATGAAAGGALLPGLSLFGTAISGAAIGQAAGALAGGLVDQALFGASGQSRVVEGPRLSDLQVLTSTAGAPIPRLYGRARIAGEIIWATPFEEQVVRQSAPGGGKGTGSGSGGSTQQIEYRYFANFAVALAEGEITRLGRVWADGKELDLSRFTHRVYRGGEEQMPDSLIAASLAPDEAPAYRGVAYVVFEQLALARFGNRIPQLSFEVFRAVDDFEDNLRAVAVIPSAGEFVYEPEAVTREAGSGVTISENVHTSQGGSDWTVSIDSLQDSLANVSRGSLVVSWFGTDLRAGHCELRPGVEISDKITRPYQWSAGSVTRDGAHLVSKVDGRPAFGGTPADASVVAAIHDLKARGVGVTFYPFILMDIPSDNTLPDPHGDTAQPPYPWRGRITVAPAPGQPGSPDKTVLGAEQLDAFMGTASLEDFSVSGETVSYSGPAEWGYRRMILHYAHLCAAAGGVDAFLIGSELRGLTQVRDGPDSYPFVAALAELAGEVKSILPAGTLVTYAADWSEYFGHQPTDGTSDVYFHLDPLWSSEAIDAVGIDVYWPLSDWRDGEEHVDRLAGWESIHDLAYLRANVLGGEGYDWHYANDADRATQVRTAITDGHGTPWIFRFKDIVSWWRSSHFDRPGGTPRATPTAWVPESKPIWFTEIGCPAIDRGSNQPNVFYDPKSSESRLPRFSRGSRDDLIQRRYIEAVTSYFDPNSPEYDAVRDPNPLSTVYDGRMLDLAHVYVYAWDARPFPAFPYALEVWADGDNWDRGHWLNGRMASGSVAAVVAGILQDYGFTESVTDGLTATLDGYVLDRIMSARQALQPLELAFFFDSMETGGRIAFRERASGRISETVLPDKMVESKAGASLLEWTRAQESELPAVAKVSYLDSIQDYRQNTSESRRLAGRSTRVASARLPIVLSPDRAQAIAETWLHEAWLARESLQIRLPPSFLALEPGDVVRVDDGNEERCVRITGLDLTDTMRLEARISDAAIYDAPPNVVSPPDVHLPAVFGPALAVFLDLPLLPGREDGHRGFVAAYQSPWSGSVAFYRSAGASGFALKARALAPAVIGITQSALPAGPVGRWDKANRVVIRLDNGSLASAERLAVLGGENILAIETGTGTWELLQFINAELIGEKTYEISVLLRGQIGSDADMAASVPAGARAVLLDEAVTPVDMTADEVGLAFNWRYGPGTLDPGHESYQQTSFAFRGIGLRPLRPAHIRATRNSGHIEIEWIRRTRINGDSWETRDVPLGEVAEAYEVDILDGGQVVRTLETVETGVVYSQADQIADFGAPQPSVSVRVYQTSPTFGRGAPAERAL